MGVKRGYSITVVDTNKDAIVRDATYWEDDVESVGGIGNLVESVAEICGQGEKIEVKPFWYE
jgi:hypothetical protein